MGLNLLGRGVNSSDKTFYKRKYVRNKNTSVDAIDRERRYKSLPGYQPTLIVKFLKEGKSKGQPTLNEVSILNDAYRGNNPAMALRNQILLLEKAIMHNIHFAQCIETTSLEQSKHIAFLKYGNNYKKHHMLYNFVDGNPMYIKMSVVSMIKDSEHSNLAILRKVITEAEHIKDFPDLAKHKELLEQLTKYTAQVVEEMTHNPHYFDALYAKYSKASNLVEDKSSILTK